MTTPTFKDVLDTLPATTGITAILLLNAAGETITRLENQPGTAGSVRVYHALIKQHGLLDRAAAREGLALYAEHTADARQHPGKHPNIDRLLAIAEADAPDLRARIVVQDD